MVASSSFCGCSRLALLEAFFIEALSFSEYRSEATTSSKLISVGCTVTMKLTLLVGLRVSLRAIVSLESLYLICASYASSLLRVLTTFDSAEKLLFMMMLSCSRWFSVRLLLIFSEPAMSQNTSFVSSCCGDAPPSPLPRFTVRTAMLCDLDCSKLSFFSSVLRISAPFSRMYATSFGEVTGICVRPLMNVSPVHFS